MSNSIQFLERHQDYVMGPNQVPGFASIAPGQILTGITLNLDPDAPFLLRSRGARCQYDALRTQAALQGLRLRFSGPNQDYRQQVPVPLTLSSPYYGQLGSPKPVYPQIWYPPKGTIYVDVQNSGASTITNLTLLFRGVKLYPSGSQQGYTYPHNISDRRDYRYPFNELNAAGQPVNMTLPVTTATNGVQKIFTPKPSSDFVIRGIQAGNGFGPFPNEVFIAFQDENQKPYSNDLVPMDFMSANPGAPAAFPYGPTPNFSSAIGTGGAHPGLFYPELYLPQKHILYFYISRQDQSFANQVPISYPLCFIGEKVYA